MYTSSSTSISAQQLVNELRGFIRGALKLERCNPLELTKTSLKLLRTLPAARSAIFEYFSNVFIDAAAQYVRAIETEISTGARPTASETGEIVVSEIHTVLIALIADRPTAWAPTISTWSLDLLGEISTKFAGRAHISTNLNEILQLWMNCQATKVLVDINTKCLSSLMHSDTETCIGALLDTSIKHSPHFDWVVAHVGSCFPNTVITRVLSCGLKDFSLIKAYEQGSNSPKLRSVVGILGHLAGSHSNDIRSAIIEMFERSAKQDVNDSDVVKLQKKATVPFILQISYLSPTLFSTICHDVQNAVSVEVIESLFHFIDDWCRYFGSSEILQDLLINLILNCDTGGIHLINLLLDCALAEQYENNPAKKVIKEKSLEILQSVIYRIEDNIRHSILTSIMTSLANDVDELHENLLSSKQIKAQIAACIITFLGSDSPSVIIKTVGHLLQKAEKPDQLSLLVHIVTSELIERNTVSYEERGGYFSVVLEQLLSQNTQVPSQSRDQCSTMTWNNLLTLLRWEMSGRVPALNSQIISKAIRANLSAITTLYSRETANIHTIAKVLDSLGIPDVNKSDALPIKVVLNMTHSTINYFFTCCTEEGTSKKMKGFKMANNILKRLCLYSKVARVAALREVLERALFRGENVIFGAKSNAIFNDNLDKMLLKQNKKINKTIPLTKHSSVFNGGIIGSGKRKLLSANELSPDVIAFNTSELINIIKSCCASADESEIKYSDLSLDSVTLVSLLLVQFVSPDVMYNGLPWPDEEFSKVTIERDLFILRLFTNTPVLWELLNFVATFRPALCYSSVLIRALTATLIHQWKSTGDQSKSDITENYKSLMFTTVKVIDVMALSQLLPPPLSMIRDVLPHLKCFEIVAILKDCLWCFMRDLIPSPALFMPKINGVHWRNPTTSRPPEMYTNTLRIIMQKNIENLGDMYAQMFINLPQRD